MLKWISFPVILCLTADALLLAQGIFMFRQNEEHLRWFGRFTALLAVLGFIGQTMLFSGKLLLTSEFGIVIVQGLLPLLGLNIMIFGLTVGAGWGWHAACLRVESRHLEANMHDGDPTQAQARLVQHQTWRLRMLTVIGIAVGLSSIIQILRLSALLQEWIQAWPNGLATLPNIKLISAFQFLPVNPTDPEPLRIFAYDLRWPPLLIWLSVCLTHSILKITGSSSPIWRWWVVSLIIVGQSFWAYPLVTNKLSSGLWLVFVPLAVLINIVLATRLFLQWRFESRSSPSLLAIAQWWNASALGRLLHVLPQWWLLSVVLAGVFEGLWLLIFYLTNLTPETPGTIRWMILAVGWTPLILGLAGIRRLLSTGFERYRKLRQAQQSIWPQMPSHLDGKEIGLIASLAMVAVSLTFLFYDIAGIGPALPLFCFFVFWATVGEVVAKCPLLTITRIVWRGRHSLLATNSLLRQSSRQATPVLKTIVTSFGKWLNDLISIKTAPLAIVKALIVIALLIALSEVPNAGKTIVLPFATVSSQEQSTSANTADGNTEERSLGQALSDRLVNNLGSLSQELQPDIIFPEPGEQGGATISFVNSSANISGVDAVLASNSDLEVSSVKVPISLLVTPIQTPIRTLLGVRLISGSFQDDRDGYTLLALSSKGETWKAIYSRRDRTQAVISGTEELAFHIISSDAGLTTVGMTRSWEAFRLFSMGLKAWQKFESSGDGDALSSAIAHFSAATQTDRSFALAFYRLGLARQSSGQPNGAVDAFRDSLAANPKFVPAYNALAYMLHNYSDYDSSTKSAVLPLKLTLHQEARKDEARNLWQEIVLFPDDAVSTADRASAYYGLCLDASQRRQYPLTYFYCQQAERLYGELSSALRADPRIKRAEAAVLNTLGFALSELVVPLPTKRLFTGRYTFDDGSWYCQIATYDREAKQLRPPSINYALAALHYFDQALALQPNDPDIRCNAASISYALDSYERMNSLESDAAAHLSRAEQYRLLAKIKTQQDGQDALVYYRAALDEYRAAIKLDGTNVWALDGFAYTCWQWHLDYVRDSIPAEPDKEIHTEAKQYAEQAFQLIERGEAPSDQTMVLASLGTMFLHQGQLDQAIQYLDQSSKILTQAISQYGASLRNTLTPLSSNEIRWDLAQAYLCSASRKPDLPPEDAQKLKDKALALLEQIRQYESTGGFRPFIESDLLEPTCLVMKPG